MLNEWLLNILQVIFLVLATSFLYENYKIFAARNFLYLSFGYGILSLGKLITLAAQTGFIFYAQSAPAEWISFLELAAETGFYFFFLMTLYLSWQTKRISRNSIWIIIFAAVTLLSFLVLYYQEPLGFTRHNFVNFLADTIFIVIHIVFISLILLKLQFSANSLREAWIRNIFYILLFAKFVHVVNLYASKNSIIVLQRIETLCTFFGFIVLSLFHFRLKLQTKIILLFLIILIIPCCLTVAIVSDEVSEKFSRISNANLSTNKIETIGFDITRVLYLIAGAGITFASIVGFIFSRRLIYPIGQLMKGTESLSRGDLDYQIKLKRSDEIGELVNAFNVMTFNLKESTEKLQKSFRETRTAMEKLDDAQQKLLQTEKMMSIQKLISTGEIAAGVAHEINNPLTNIISFIKFMRQKTEKDDVRYKPLEIVERESARITRIAKNLKNFARRKQPALAPVDINQPIEDTLSIIEYQFTRDKIEIAKQLQTNLPPVLANRDQLQQVFLNLAINARDAMPEGGTLKIATTAVREKDDDLWVEVRFEDNGCGIPEDEIKDIFTPFFSTKGEGKGSGLGLSISCAIIKKHKAAIKVKSKVNIGTTFIIRFPQIGDGKEEQNQEEKSVEEATAPKS